MKNVEMKNGEVKDGEEQDGGMKNVEVKDGDGLGAVYVQEYIYQEMDWEVCDGICLGVCLPRDGLGGV